MSSVTVRRIQMTGDAQRTISSTPVAATAAGSACQSGALVGVLGEGQQPVADGGAGRLVPGRQQEDEERGQLAVGQRLAVDVGGDEGGGEVVAVVSTDAALGDRLISR